MQAWQKVHGEWLFFDAVQSSWHLRCLLFLCCDVMNFDQTELNMNIIAHNKQLLVEVEHDSMNYQNRGLCYLLKLKAETEVFII